MFVCDAVEEAGATRHESGMRINGGGRLYRVIEGCRISITWRPKVKQMTGGKAANIHNG